MFTHRLSREVVTVQAPSYSEDLNLGFLVQMFGTVIRSITEREAFLVNQDRSVERHNK